MRRLLVSALGLSTLFLAAQQPAPAPAPASAAQAAPAKPTPGPEMDRLKALLGSFKVDEKMTGAMGPSGVNAGFSRISEGPGGFTILIDYTTLSGPNHGMKGHGVLGWDAEAKTYKQVWVDSMGPMIEVSTGAWEGDNLVLTASGTMMGKAYQSRTTVSGISADGFTVTGEISLDGGPMQKVVELVHHRMAPAAKPAPAAK